METTREFTRADILHEGVRLCADARKQVVEVNVAYFLVHKVVSAALRAGAKETNRASLDAALQFEIEQHFDPVPSAISMPA